MEKNYLDLLMDDHALIERTLILLQKELENSDNINLSTVKTLIEVLWIYGETCHNMKEEKVYFPLLMERGLPEGGPVSVMLSEHQQERDYLKMFEMNIQTKEEGGNLPENFFNEINAYIELTKGHIWKENDILYPMGNRILSASDNSYLINGFHSIEKEAIGEGAYIRYFTLVSAIEKKAGGKPNFLESLPLDILNNMLDAIPVEISYVDSDDRVRYFNKLEQKKIFARTLSVIGRTVQQCHPQHSVHLVNKILEEMKAGTRDKASFWINFEEMFVYIAYFAVRDENGIYQGCVEIVQDVKPFRELEGDKRLLDEN